MRVHSHVPHWAYHNCLRSCCLIEASVCVYLYVAPTLLGCTHWTGITRWIRFRRRDKRYRTTIQGASLEGKEYQGVIHSKGKITIDGKDGNVEGMVNSLCSLVLDHRPGCIPACCETFKVRGAGGYLMFTGCSTLLCICRVVVCYDPTHLIVLGIVTHILNTPHSTIWHHMAPTSTNFHHMAPYSTTWQTRHRMGVGKGTQGPTFQTHWSFFLRIKLSLSFSYITRPLSLPPYVGSFEPF